MKIFSVCFSEQHECTQYLARVTTLEEANKLLALFIKNDPDGADNYHTDEELLFDSMEAFLEKYPYYAESNQGW